MSHPLKVKTLASKIVVQMICMSRACSCAPRPSTSCCVLCGSWTSAALWSSPAALLRTCWQTVIRQCLSEPLYHFVLLCASRQGPDGVNWIFHAKFRNFRNFGRKCPKNEGDMELIVVLRPHATPITSNVPQ